MHPGDLVLWLEREQRQEGPVERRLRQFLVRGIMDRALKHMPRLRDGPREHWIPAPNRVP